MSNLLIIIFLLIIGVQLIRILLSFRYLASSKKAVEKLNKSSNTDSQLILLIPVLNEQAIIHTSVDYFSNITAQLDWVKVVYVTTEKETLNKNNLQTTREVIEAIKLKHQRIDCIHYPGTQGVMAHQLNYAMQCLLEKNSSEEVVFGIYNVDSMPCVNALLKVREAFSCHHNIVVQQYSVYPYDKVDSFSSAVLSHIALWQTRWSLQFELGRLLLSQKLAFKNSPSTSKRLLQSFHYIIGHGFFYKKNLWLQTTGFPEDEINEDAFLGLQISLSDYKLKTVPYLEVSLPPTGISIYLKQQAVWYNGPAHAWRYFAKLFKGSDGRHCSRNRISGLEKMLAFSDCFKLWLHSIYWMFGPPIILGAVPAFFIINDAYWYLSGWIFLSLCFVWGEHWLCWYLTQRLGIKLEKPGGIVASLIAYALHGLGPLLWLARSFQGNNTQDKKYKTEKLVKD